jgi:hypothetical protein
MRISFTILLTLLFLGCQKGEPESNCSVLLKALNEKHQKLEEQTFLRRDAERRLYECRHGHDSTDTNKMLAPDL